MVSYEKNVWADGDIEQTVEENSKKNAVVNAVKMNHIENGISNVADAINIAQTTADDATLKATDAQTTADDATTKAADAQSTAEGKLSLSGGTVTGDVDFKKNITKNSVDIATLLDNVASASKLETIRNINGVGFDGTAPITVFPYFIDTRSENKTPQWYAENYPRQIATEFKNLGSVTGTGLIGNWAALLTFVPYVDTGTNAVSQLIMNSSGIAFRGQTNGANSSTWGAWSKL